MTYEEFKAAYESLVTLFLKYTPNEVGHLHYAGKLADLTDAYPEFEARLDSES